MATVKSLKVSSVSPSSERIMKGSDEGLTLKDLKLLPRPVYIINSVDNTKLPCYTLPLTQHHSFLRNLPPYSFNYQLSYSELISIECRKTNTRVITTANHRKVKRLQEDEVKISKQFEGQENASDPKV